MTALDTFIALAAAFAGWLVLAAIGIEWKKDPMGTILAVVVVILLVKFFS